jgi:hypothetical protein
MKELLIIVGSNVKQQAVADQSFADSIRMNAKSKDFLPALSQLQKNQTRRLRKLGY